MGGVMRCRGSCPLSPWDVGGGQKNELQRPTEFCSSVFELMSRSGGRGGGLLEYCHHWVRAQKKLFLVVFDGFGRVCSVCSVVHSRSETDQRPRRGCCAVKGKGWLGAFAHFTPSLSRSAQPALPCTCLSRARVDGVTYTRRRRRRRLLLSFPPPPPPSPPAAAVL